MDAQFANGFIVDAKGSASADRLVAGKGTAHADRLVAGKGTAPADPLVAGKGTAPADPLVAGKGTAPADLDDADGWKAADWTDCAELDDEDVAGEEEESAAAGGGVAPHPLGQPAAPPLSQVMGMAEMVIELVPLVVPVTVLLFGWFGGAWLE